MAGAAVPWCLPYGLNCILQSSLDLSPIFAGTFGSVAVIVHGYAVLRRWCMMLRSDEGL